MNVYYLHNRDWGYLYHFIFWQLGALNYVSGDLIYLYVPYIKDLENGDINLLNNIESNLGDKELLYQKNVKGDRSVYYEILNLLPEKYKIIDSYRNVPTDSVLVKLEIPRHNSYIENHEILFLKKNLITKKKLKNNIKKKIYITRNNSENLTVNKIKTRQILNEKELFEHLKMLGFEYICLENFSVPEKIQIFKDSEIIISPNSGALSFLLFCEKNTTVVELKPPVEGHTQFMELSNSLGLNYNLYNNVTYFDEGYNMSLQIEDFIKFVKNLIS
jgi:capsular polysaccharide biosynthesis protein